MKIKAEVLKSFLNKVVMTGTASLLDCILNFTEKGVEVIAQVSANTVLIKGFLNKKAFEEYEAVGKLGIENLSQIKEYTKRLEGEIKVTVKDNTLVLKAGRKKVEVLLRDVEYIEKPPTYPAEVEKTYETIFKVDYNEVKDFVEDMKAVNSKKVTVNTKKGNFVLTTKGMDSITKTVKVEGVKEDNEVKLGENFVEAIAGLEGTLELRVKSDYPVTIANKDEVSDITIIVSPI